MRKLLHAKKVWDYGFGMEVESAPHGNPRIVTNRNDEAYNVYDSRGGLIKTVRKGESCEVYKEKWIDRVYAYLVHVDSLMTTVIWKKKATMLKGLPEIIGRRYRVEKAKWIETLKVMKEMHLQINHGICTGDSSTLLSEQNVLDRNGFVVNINKMHKAFPLITMDRDLGSVNSTRRRVMNADWNRRTERGEIIPVADTSMAGVDRWFSEKGWTKEGVLAEVIEVPDDPAAARILEELRQSAGKDIDDIEVARLRELRSHLYDANGNMKPGASKEWKRYHQEAEAKRFNGDSFEKNRVQEMHDYLYDAKHELNWDNEVGKVKMTRTIDDVVLNIKNGLQQMKLSDVRLETIDDPSGC